MTLKIPNLLPDLLAAETTRDVDAILRRLPVVEPEDYSCDRAGARGTWRDGHLHWIPVGRDRGNGGRVKLAGQPANPIAERLVNGMEAVIELERLKELRKDPTAAMPASPRDAALRYFGLPRLDSIPKLTDPVHLKAMTDKINRARKKLTVRLKYDKPLKQFAVSVQDAGTGQTPDRVHETLLSLGQTDKADKPYLIGVFGQGGSSAFAASAVSLVVSRRAPGLAERTENGDLGWSLIRQVFPKARRDPYFAYLASTPDGQVPSFSAKEADAVRFKHGTLFLHIDYDFGGVGVARLLYQALNHVLFSPILPYELFALKEEPDLMQGTAQRLARRAVQLGKPPALDKSFESQLIGEST